MAGNNTHDDCETPAPHFAEKLPEQELRQILAIHEKWLASEQYPKWVEAKGPDKEAFTTGRAIFLGKDLREVDLSGANLAGAILMDANLSGANLRGAILDRDTLIRVKICNADLHEANLHAAVIHQTNFSQVQIRGANLTNAELSVLIRLPPYIHHNGLVSNTIMLFSGAPRNMTAWLTPKIPVKSKLPAINPCIPAAEFAAISKTVRPSSL